jgi:hypothetical protein
MATSIQSKLSNACHLWADFAKGGKSLNRIQRKERGGNRIYL